jgi:hypothetical protein
MADASTAARGNRAPFLFIASMLILAPYVVRLGFLERRGINPDELQHLHSAWCISEGMVPYRDYFEHHTPWLHFLLSRLFPLFDLDGAPALASELIFTARRLIWLVAGVILGSTFVLARRSGGTMSAFAAAVLLGNTTMFLSKSLEVRPDVPAAALLLVAAILVAKARPARFRYCASGIALGAAVMFTQKALFALPGFAAAFALSAVSRSTRWRDGLWYALGFALPVAGTLAVFASADALGPFIDFNFLTNARWKVRLSPLPLFAELFFQNPVVAGLGAFGLFRAAVILARGGRRPELDVTLLAAASLLAGAFIIPVPHRQYALLFLPFVAVLAGDSLVDVVRRFASRRRESALAVVLVLVSIRPAYQSRVFWERRNWATLQKIEWVLANVGPQETVLDGFSGEGVFRPHAFFYFFLHDEMRGMLGDADWNALRRGLEEGSIAPKLILYDRHLKELPREVGDYIEGSYLPAGIEPIRARFARHGWSDSLPRPLAPALEAERPPPVPYVLVSEGWHPAEREGPIALRRSRGRRSRLELPLMEPRRGEIFIEARLELEEAPVTMTLAVNGATVGELALRRGWVEYAFEIPATVVKRGLNELLLTYSVTPFQLDASRPGGNAVIAARSLRFRPAP